MRLSTGMMVSTWLAGSLAIHSCLLAAQTGSQPSVKWAGQDGHDFVGPNNRLEPSDVQDMHFVLGGLDPQQEIAFVDVLGEHGDEWQYNAQSFSWKAELKRPKGSRTADLFLEPGNIETPRNYHVLFRYENGTAHEFDVRGRKVSRSLRMPDAALQARWMGQEKQDRVGSGPSAGPDGIADVRIRLAGVSTRVPVRAMRVEGPGALKWESGSNPELLPGAEYWPDPKQPGAGDLFFQPDRDLKVQKLKVLVLYANDTHDAATVTAGRCDPRLRTPVSPLPRISELSPTVRWVGQDGQDVTGSGDVHVHLAGLARRPAIAAAVLTDAVNGTWVYRGNDRINLNVPQAENARPLAIRPGPDRGSIDLFFPPYSDEAGATLTLRLIEPDGRMSVARFDGGTCDPGRCAPRPADTRVEAKPGDDLNTLVNQYGTVSLAEGTYRLQRPLVLNRPVTLTCEGKATLVFAQAATDAPWTAAIRIHCGQTTCNGFAVRFEGPVRWNQEVSYGPAVIATTDNEDQAHPELKAHIVLTRLDLESPPAADPSKWVDALRLIRLTNARGGMIAGNILRGGPIEFFEGPWHLLNNDFRGTSPGTISHSIFVGHKTYDLRVRGNRAKPVQPEGKTWRFLVLTHHGTGDRVEENLIEDIGSREGDTIPASNEPEIILTEGYHLKYEGRIAALSTDGRLLRIDRPQGQETVTGDLVALLTGPAAGKFRRVAQVIDPETFLVDAAIPKGTEAVSIARGFVGESFLKNRIDIRGGQKSAGMVLVGNHFGTRVIGNHLLGGANSIRFAACPTETPVVWGWSHAPFLGVVIEDNILEDAAGGAVLGVEHSATAVKSNKGRTYMTIALSRNVVRWTEPFLQRYASSGAKAPPPGLVLGYLPSHDPEEFVVHAADNRLEAPARLQASESLLVRAARFNSQKLLNRVYSLPAGPVGTADAPHTDAAGSGSSRR